jgi:hypothetical protein
VQTVVTVAVLVVAGVVVYAVVVLETARLLARRSAEYPLLGELEPDVVAHVDEDELDRALEAWLEDVARPVA